MSFLRDQPETIAEPRLNAFLDVCKTTHPSGFLHTDDVVQPNILQFAPNLFILRWVPERNDFIYRLWGTAVVDVYGMDLTGKYIADGDHKETERPFIDAHLECLRDQKLIYLGGTIHWRERDYRPWNQVTMPLQRNDEVRETISYVVFD